jgi:hypothetical protein
MATRPANVDKVGRSAADSGQTAAVVRWVVVYVVVIIENIIACMDLISIRSDFTQFIVTRKRERGWRGSLRWSKWLTWQCQDAA